MRISREEGVPVLWRGVGANVARAMLMTASQLATYDIFKQSLLRTSCVMRPGPACSVPHALLTALHGRGHAVMRPMPGTSRTTF